MTSFEIDPCALPQKSLGVRTALAAIVGVIFVLPLSLALATLFG